MADHPSDTIPAESTFEKKTTIVDSDSLKDQKNYKYKTNDNFYVIDYFNSNGIAKGKVDSNVFGLINEIRIRITKQVENWILIHEITLFD